ncbi:MAG: hypothetical protein AABZ02_15015, partial [Bacteroidota bacterium]
MVGGRADLHNADALASQGLGLSASRSAGEDVVHLVHQALEHRSSVTFHSFRIWPKPLSSAFFSTSAPFMVLTYLMRGIDIPTMLTAMMLAFLFIIGAVQVAVVVACVPASRIFKAALALATAG